MTHVRAWVALAERDLRLVLRSRSQLYSSLLTPLILLAVLGTGVSHGLQPAGVREGDYTSFLLSGIIVMTALFSSTFSSGSYYRDRDTGMLRSLILTPHSARCVLFGKGLAAVTIGAMQAALMLVLAIALPPLHIEHQYGWVPSIALAAAAILLLCVVLAGLAQLLASAIATMQGFHLVMNLLLFPLLFFSGAFFPLTDLPAWLAWAGRLNPITYAVEPLQLAMYAPSGEGYLHPAASLGVLAALALMLITAGLSRVPRVI